MPHRPVPKEFKDKLSHWGYRSRIWIRLHYLLGVTATVFSVLVTTEILAGSKTIKPIFSLTAAVTAGLITFLKPSERAKGYHEAHSLLVTETEKYELDPNYTQLMLVTVQEKAQHIVDSD